jgi:hypothetical protein
MRLAFCPVLFPLPRRCWRERRQIAEAMPHETPVTDVSMFRTVCFALALKRKVNVPAHRICDGIVRIAVSGRNSLVSSSP